MPPALSDDEMFVAGNGAGETQRSQQTSGDTTWDLDDSSAATGRSNGARVNDSPKKKEVSVPVVKDGDKEEGDDNGDEEEEYEVQEIVGHMLDDQKQPRFRVLWKGYPDESDHTWEPEENLAVNASIILNEYFAQIGGRETIFKKVIKGRKRGRAYPITSSARSTASAAKRRKEIKTEHPAIRESPPFDLDLLFKPPAGSWEDEVVAVEMYRGEDGELRVCLTWKNGSKSQHAAQQAYLRCPQKILQFYESRISFKSFVDDS